MAFDETLAGRIRAVVRDQPEFAERKMFGGLAFHWRGHMCCGIVGADLMVRIGDGYERALAEPHVRPMDFTGRPLKGMIYVGSAGIATDEALRAWIGRAVRFAETLPEKRPKAASKLRRPNRRRTDR